MSGPRPSASSNQYPHPAPSHSYGAPRSAERPPAYAPIRNTERGGYVPRGDHRTYDNRGGHSSYDNRGGGGHNSYDNRGGHNNSRGSYNRPPTYEPRGMSRGDSRPSESYTPRPQTQPFRPSNIPMRPRRSTRWEKPMTRQEVSSFFSQYATFILSAKAYHNELNLKNTKLEELKEAQHSSAPAIGPPHRNEGVTNTAASVERIKEEVKQPTTPAPHVAESKGSNLNPVPGSGTYEQPRNIVSPAQVINSQQVSQNLSGSQAQNSSNMP